MQIDRYARLEQAQRMGDALVAERVERIGKALGFDITEPTGLIRAGLALTAWRLLDDA
ncbi:hypothetical protein [Streptomyces sp. NPDC051218]|uniref:hypothetical protein n=1 Tax=Streptomyces sp. NPDC051218 TaxID=3365645 RepID=UPI0037B1F029